MRPIALALKQPRKAADLWTGRAHGGSIFAAAASPDATSLPERPVALPLRAVHLSSGRWSSLPQKSLACRARAQPGVRRGGTGPRPPGEVRRGALARTTW